MSQEQLGMTLALGIAGVLGYYARSTPMDMGTCKSIEEARVKVLRAAGYATGWPRGGGRYTIEQRRGGWSHTNMHTGSQRQHTATRVQRRDAVRMESGSPAIGAGRDEDDGGVH
eukprot:5110401-Pleurochrysis_carterae.AAC.1